MIDAIRTSPVPVQVVSTWATVGPYVGRDNTYDRPAHAEAVLSALAATQLTGLRILDVSSLHLEGGETVDMLKTILNGAAKSLTHLSITACPATAQAFENVSLSKLTVLHLSCARNEPASFACACLSQLSHHWEGHGYCPDVIELRQGNAPLLSDGIDVPSCLPRIRHLDLYVYNSDDRLSKALSFLTRCSALERLTLTAHPKPAEILQLKRAYNSLSDVRLHLCDGDKPLDTSLPLALSDICTELTIETPVGAADWEALSVVGDTLRKLKVTVAPDGLPAIGNFLLHADALEELLIRNMSDYGGDANEGTVTTQAWQALADGVGHASRLTHLDIELVDNDQGLIVAMPTDTVDGVVKVMEAFGERAKRFVVELTLTAFADDHVYRAMLRIMQVAAECMPAVETFEVDVYSTLMNEDWETRDKDELMQMLRDVIDAAEQLETKLSCVRSLSCCSCREDIAKAAKQALEEVEQSDM